MPVHCYHIMEMLNKMWTKDIIQFWFALAFTTHAFASPTMKCDDEPIKGTTEVSVHCTVPAINVDMAFDMVPVNNTRILTFKCPHSKELSRMDRDTFSQFVRIQRLKTVNCKFESIPEDAFNGLRNLQWLLIEVAKPPKVKVNLPSAFSGDLQNVTKLELTGIGFGIVPETFWSNLPLIDYVIFVRNMLTDLKWLDSLKNLSLSSLDLSENYLTFLPFDAFQATPRLSSLVLRKNMIDIIHEKAFYPLKALRVLDLSSNNITVLPSNVFRFQKNLKILFLFSNNLNAFPSDIFNELTMLKILDIGINILHFSDSHVSIFNNLKRLYKLSLNHANISFLPTSVFSGLRNLRVLDLSDNDLSNVNSSVFSSIHKLQTLLVRSCDLQSFEFLAHLPLLTHLYARKNHFLKPTYDDLIKCPHLEAVDLGGTGMTTIQHDNKGIFSNFSRLTFLKINSNPVGEFDYSFVPDSVSYLDLTKTRIHTINDKFGVRNRKRITKFVVTQNNFNEWNSESFGQHIRELTCSDCVINNIRTGTFSNSNNLKSIWFLKTLLQNINRFAFRHTYPGAQTVTPVVTFENNVCETTAHWTIFDIRFIRFRSSEGKYVCQMTTRCKSGSAYKLYDVGKIEAIAANIVRDVIFDCGNNNMTFFSYNFENHEKVSVLYMDGNRIPVLRNDTFANMSSLQSLYLNDSYIASMETGAFFGLKDLARLYLHNNELITLIVRQFIQQAHLSVVWLQNNKIKSFEKTVFSWQFRLSELRLNDNRLERLERSELSKLKALKYLFLNSNNLTYISPNTFYTQHALLELHLENNSLQHISPNAFSGTRQLKTLFLNSNKFSYIGQKTFKVPLKLHTLHFEDNVISKIHPLAFQNLKDLIELHLEGNELEFLNGSIFKSKPNFSTHCLTNITCGKSEDNISRENKLQRVFLHNNRLRWVDVKLLSSLKHLVNLTLHNNQLKQFSVWELPTSLQSITLRNNNLSCECSFLTQFQTWIIGPGRNKVSDIGKVFCKHQNGTNAKLPLMQYTETYCRKKPSLLIPLFATGGTFIVVIVVTILGYLHRLEMQVWLYSRYGVRLFYPNNDADVGKRYHAFVAFSSDDEELVAQHLVPGLEPQFRLCIHTRDFPLGAIITGTICEVVENSCRTLLVLTNNFINSEWCKFEFKMAHFQTIQDHCCRLIVISFEDVDMNAVDKELKAYLKTNTYLRWGEPFFWEKLRFAMPHIENLQEIGERQPLLTN